MRPIFLGEALFLLRTAVIDIHDVHGAITNIGQHIDTPEVTQVVSYSGKALGKNIRTNKVNVIVHATEIEVYAILLKQIFLEIVFLLTDPGERKAHCQMDVG